MKRRIKSMIKWTVSGALVAAGLFFLQKLLVPKYAADVVEGALIAEYYQEEKDHDVIFIGDCEVYENFSPQLLWDEYGINSYIRGSAQQLIWQSYYLLEDTLRYETPQVVVFNVLSMEYDTPQKEAYNRMTLEGMEWSKSKHEAILASMTEKENYTDYVFPILRYHSRWSELSGTDIDYMFDTPKVSHNGYYMRVDVKAAEHIPEGKPLADYGFGENAYLYLDKLTKLCKVNNIELILVKAPSLYPYWYDEWEEQIEAYAKENDLVYINFLELTQETGVDFQTDTYDGGLHMNLSGAEKITRYLGEFLSEEAGVPDRRGESGLSASWDEKRAWYEKDRREQLLAMAEKGARPEDTGESETPQEAVLPGEPEGMEYTDKKPIDYKGYTFTYQGIRIAMDMEASSVLKRLGEADSYFEAASCAFDGLDKKYTYESFELDTYPGEDADHISAVLFRDDSVTTEEGIGIGDSQGDVFEVYGEDFLTENGMIVYRKDDMKLCFIITDEVVSSIEYRTTVLDE